MPFNYSDLLPIGKDETKYRLVTTEGVKVVKHGDLEFLEVAPEALTKLTETAIHDINNYLRSAHLEQLTKILKEKTANQLYSRMLQGCEQQCSNDRVHTLCLLNAIGNDFHVLYLCKEHFLRHLCTCRRIDQVYLKIQ